MPDTTDKGKGHATLFDGGDSTEESKSTKSATAAPEVDWDSDDNPYKDRAKGHQRDASGLRIELEGARGDQAALARIEASLETINSRIDVVEDMGAEALDFADTGRGDEDADDDSQSRRSTNARQDSVKQQRQTRGKAAAEVAHAQLAAEIKDKIANIYVEKMSDDPRVKAAAAMFNAAMNDVSKANDMWRALETLRSLAPEFADSGDDSGDDKSNPDDSKKSSTQSSKEDADSSTDSETETVEDKPTKREQLIKSTATQGQSNSGSSSGSNEADMSGLEEITAGLEGRKTEAGV